MWMEQQICRLRLQVTSSSSRKLKTADDDVFKTLNDIILHTIHDI